MRRKVKPLAANYDIFIEFMSERDVASALWVRVYDLVLVVWLV